MSTDRILSSFHITRIPDVIGETFQEEWHKYEGKIFEQSQLTAEMSGSSSLELKAQNLVSPLHLTC